MSEIIFPKYEIKWNEEYVYCLCNGDECDDDWMIKTFGTTKKILVSKNTGAVYMCNTKRTIEREIATDVVVYCDFRDAWKYRPLECDLQDISLLERDYPKWKEAAEFWVALLESLGRTSNFD